MKVTNIVKRNNVVEEFDSSKITKAIEKAMEAVDGGNLDDAEKISNIVVEKINTQFDLDSNSDPKKAEDLYPTVEQIQDTVEMVLMDEDYHDVAKAYILYRHEHSKMRKGDLFKRRVQLKPYEYPDLYEYVNAIRHSYWIHTEFNFTGDIQDFKINVNDVEKNAIQNAMLAIAQIEVAVKTFWGDIYKKIPKPEVGAVGATFAESEVRHTDAYSHLLEILDLNDDFEKIKDIPAIINRVNYLEKAIRNSNSEDKKEYTQSILLFSLFIEHVSLFSQFLIIMSFNKHKNLFKGISNAVEATSKEEQIHGLFGIDLINLIKKENPEWFDEKFEKDVIEMCEEAYEAEKGIVDWIFEEGELDFLPKPVVLEFIKNRFNNSLKSIGVKEIFTVDQKLADESDWFYDEVISTKHGDFFNKKSINYNKKSKSITSDDLF
jgi:ribonucleoside-diphosphate reductase beta chain